MPPTYQVKQDDSTNVDIHELLRRPSHHHFNLGAQEHHRNSSILQLPSTPTDFAESSFQEEVDHLLIFLTTLFPILLGLIVITAVALLVRKMRRSESVDEVSPGGDRTPGDRSFSSLPVPSVARPWWREDNNKLSSDSSKVNLSTSLPHLLVLDGKHSLSLPHLLAIETYYNYPSAASILDETFQDVVDQSKIQAEVAQGKTPQLSNSKSTRRPRSLKRTLSLKSLRRFRTRVLQLLTFRKRRERTTVGEVNARTFNLVELPTETRQQLKQIYVY